MRSMNKQKFYSIKDYCKICHISRRTVYRWIKSNQIVAGKSGKKWLIPESEIPTFLRDDDELEDKLRMELSGYKGYKDFKKKEKI